MRSPTLKTQSYKTGSPLRRIALCLVLCALIFVVAAQIREKLGISQPFSIIPQKTVAPQFIEQSEGIMLHHVPHQTVQFVCVPGPKNRMLS